MRTPTYDYLLFDLDGTLVDIDPEYAQLVISRVGERVGHPFSAEEVNALWYGGEARASVLEEYDLEPDRFWTLFHEEEDPEERARSTFLYDDAALVGQLDVPIGLVTHCQRYLAEPVLERLEIDGWFEARVYCSDEIGWKPDPNPVKRAMRDLGVDGNGHAGALIGDGPTDVGAAWNAGLDAIHVERRDPSTTGECVLGDYRVETLHEAPFTGPAAD